MSEVQAYCEDDGNGPNDTTLCKACRQWLSANPGGTNVPLSISGRVAALKKDFETKLASYEAHHSIVDTDDT